MITVSLCMIVKNEESTIERCLNSVADIVDEIIIVDTGSTDRTKELCSTYTEKIYDYQWINDFSAARNYSYSFATMDYILWLDADDILMPEDALEFLKLKETLNPEVNAVMMKYNTGFDLRGNVVFSYYRERLVKREANFKWMEPVHEYLQVYGRTINSNIAITHGKPPGAVHGTRNLEIYEGIKKRGDSLSPRGMYYYARELKDHGRTAEAIVQFEEFLASGLGWKEDNITACGELAKCYFEINHSEKALLALLRSFVYDTPRAEICCQLGYYYQKQEDYRRAAFWFEFILTLEKPADSWGFIQPDCWDYIPFIELAVCYDHIGNYKKAGEYNDQALLIKPYSAAALSNQVYFKNKP
ncbi:MAG TPA: glycosyltransferase family 2 protein [Clostridiales bacterium]|nr:glycosyltransferase family 2 protein [Clostridiales bacterium]